LSGLDVHVPFNRYRKRDLGLEIPFPVLRKKFNQKLKKMEDNYYFELGRYIDNPGANNKGIFISCKKYSCDKFLTEKTCNESDLPTGIKCKWNEDKCDYNTRVLIQTDDCEYIAKIFKIENPSSNQEFKYTYISSLLGVGPKVEYYLEITHDENLLYGCIIMEKLKDTLDDHVRKIINGDNRDAILTTIIEMYLHKMLDKLWLLAQHNMFYTDTNIGNFMIDKNNKLYIIDYDDNLIEIISKASYKDYSDNEKKVKIIINLRKDLLTLQNGTQDACSKECMDLLNKKINEWLNKDRRDGDAPYEIPKWEKPSVMYSDSVHPETKHLIEEFNEFLEQQKNL